MPIMSQANQSLSRQCDVAELTCDIGLLPLTSSIRWFKSQLQKDKKKTKIKQKQKHYGDPLVSVVNVDAIFLP